MINICIGTIASGKSTYCKECAKKGCIILNDDAIVNALHNNDYTLYNESLKPLYKSIEDHILHSAILLKKDVIVDRGLDVRMSSRQRWLAIGRALDVSVRAICFEVFSPEIHGTRRFEADSRGHSLEYWIDVARKHLSCYQPPTLEEGFSEIEFKKWQ